jgi:benzoyl-CoA reductase/2-hydroxyglutaryl-CoA dehydratase subunit BcrC/BadD/HgdB
MTSLEVMQRHYNQRDLAAREWKKQGGKVVGYFCDSVPEEMVSAAGFFPIRLSGDPQGPTDIARKYLIPRFTDREGFVDSMLNMLLTGVYDFLDYLIIPHARDSIHRLYQLLVTVRKNEPDRHLPELFFLDTLHTTFFSSGMYERDRFIELKEKLEMWSGQKMTSPLLSEAIETTNENRRLLRKVVALRAADPPCLSGVEALQIIGSSLVMRKKTHNELLHTFLDEADKRSVLNGRRVFVAGSPLDNLQLYKLIEANNAVVVSEDHCWGNRYSHGLIDTTRDPLEAIVDRYHFRAPCPRMYPMNRRIAHCLRGAEEAGAQQAIFFVYKHDNAEAWEIPEKVKALTEKGIGALILKNQPYGISEPEKLNADLNNFLALR